VGRPVFGGHYACRLHLLDAHTWSGDQITKKTPRELSVTATYVLVQGRRWSHALKGAVPGCARVCLHCRGERATSGSPLAILLGYLSGRLCPLLRLHRLITLDGSAEECACSSERDSFH